MDNNDIDKEVYGLLSKIDPIKKPLGRRPILLITAGIFLVLIEVAVFFFTPFLIASEEPEGKIIYPRSGSKTDREIRIEGYTKNIPTERPHIWLTVNREDLGLCWPKRPGIKANSRFAVTILEEGKEKDFTVCLYALDPTYHQEILNWLKEGRISGLRIFQDRHRLDSVEYELKGL